MAMPDKTSLRNNITGKLKAVDSAHRLTVSKTISEQILKLSAFQNASAVLLYDADETEIATEDLAGKILNEGKRVAYPRTEPQRKQLRLFQVTEIQAQMELSRFGFREPKTNLSEIPPEEIDLILVPGRAFDEKGNRLGRGAGYFDRFMANSRTNAYAIAPAYDFQIVDSIPTEKHDFPVDAIVTEKRTIVVREYS